MLYCVVWLRLVNKVILDRLQVVRYQETLLVFNENVDVAMAHVSVSFSLSFVLLFWY